MQFREFWPQYLRAHSLPATRAVHYGATLIGVGSAILAIACHPMFLSGVAIAYGLAIGAHAVFEKNRSLIRVNPFWGALADLRMFSLALTGGLAAELQKAGAQPAAPATRATGGSTEWPARQLTGHN
jgi:hypothetical protein